MLDKNYIYQIRHSCAHLLAGAVLELYPGTKPTIGPAIENGFYYDFDFGDTKISIEDLTKIESRMHDLAKSWNQFERLELTPDQALKMFADNSYKIELINELIENKETITAYKSGEFVDLCKGGHCENPSTELKYFQLLSVAGAYWRGDEKNKMLTRIYGTCFTSQQDLDDYLNNLEEAKKRDHKKLGKELDLFFIDEEIGQGLPMWTPKGTAIKHELEKYTRNLEKRFGYQHISTPYLGSEKLYKRSGHLDHYSENMYAPIDMDGQIFYLRPMACPHHIRMYQHYVNSYKDLPIRYAEIADYNRFEKSGELMGLIRVRKFQLTDAHVFVSHEGLKEEFKHTIKMIIEGITTLGIIERVRFRFSRHDSEDQHKYYPDPNLWDHAESVMKQALDEIELEYYEAIGEAAFYGPKLDVQMVNVNGKEDTAFTAQIDFLLPEKFDLYFINHKGERERPAMIHRSAIGCLERTFAFLIEHYAGNFPLWLSPTQVRILAISEKVSDYAYSIYQKLLTKDIRVELDIEAETIGNKIRKAQTDKIPYMVIVGENEANNNTISVRTRGGQQEKDLDINVFISRLILEIEERK